MISPRTFQGTQGHLVTITEAAENSFVLELLGPTVNQELWLGATQADPSMEPHEGWQWVTGETWEFTNWGPNEPNDFGGSEAYLRMRGPAHINAGSWNDGIGTTTSIQGYVVEYDLRPQCAGDLFVDGAVNLQDLLDVLDAWGRTDSLADLNKSGTVDLFDLLSLLDAWGPCE